MKSRNSKVFLPEEIKKRDREREKTEIFPLWHAIVHEYRTQFHFISF